MDGCGACSRRPVWARGGYFSSGFLGVCRDLVGQSSMWGRGYDGTAPPAPPWLPLEGTEPGSIPRLLRIGEASSICSLS